LFIVFALVLMNTPTSVQAATQIYFTNFNSGYADWTVTSPTGGISLTTSPVISGSAVHILNTVNITRTVSTVGYYGISVTSNLAASLLETNDGCYAEYNTGSGTLGSSPTNTPVPPTNTPGPATCRLKNKIGRGA
jgi:hypothetical protein